MNILITGGAGFIGSHTYVVLKENGFTPIIVDNFANSSTMVLDRLQEITLDEVTCIEGDVNDASMYDQIFNKYAIEGVIHFAAYKAVGESVENPLKYYRNNVAATVLLLEKMQEYGIKNLVFSSSCTVYGQPESLPVTESAPIQPAVSPYGNSKQICEEIIRDSVQAKNAHLKAISLRYFNPIGAHKSALIGELPIGPPANLVPFLTQSVAGIRGPLQIFGDDYPTPDGTAIRDYIHVCDLAEAHVKALSYLLKHSDSPYYDYFNIGTGMGSSVLEVIHAFEKATGKKVHYEIKPRRSGDITAVYAATNKSKEVLNWSTQKSLEEALLDSWKWQEQLLKS
ncbi:UDP-glucose 4-epimerase GalE [Aquirufa rosea]|uniref:UDP-glucose 4-epimerase n=1 Tax=Aquirufa rosea TaxID=2509241 RepID=A0A4Q1C2Y6_9BACT|nr:UDP-glucose 4-epimerase GalE [Aquirufa rosea]RXK52441.1 UDP-glucose 4-epimerase GalE [Aquirufa rosea]